MNDSFPKIYIAGPDFLQNQLLAVCLEKELAVECECFSDLSINELTGKNPERVRVLLLDCARLDMASLEKHLETANAIGAKAPLSALINVDPTLRIDRLVYRHKIRGIFFTHDTRQIFLKGILAILDGQLWLSRRMMSESILRSEERQRNGGRAAASLSDREKEVILLVAMGSSNDEIANKLHISTHTVKTHLSSIYRKIGVSNRLQAALWASAQLIE